MAEILISVLLEQLASLAVHKIREKGRQVKNVKKEVSKLTSKLQAINDELLDAEERQFEEKAVRGWLEKLHDMSCEIDDALDEWNTAILRFEGEKEERGKSVHAGVSNKVCFFMPSSWFPCVRVRQVGLRLNISCKIKELNERLSELYSEGNTFSFRKLSSTDKRPEREKTTTRTTTSFVDVTEVHGRDEEKKILVDNLLCESGSQSGRRISIIPIVGMGGLGKTTLAQLVYNDDRVKAQFPCRIWVCVSKPFDEIKVAKAIIESLTGNAAPGLLQLENLHQCIGAAIVGKKFLLVLDDVWADQDDEQWEKLKKPLELGAMGSRILVTTREKEVATMMEAEARMITLESLSEEVCWTIFSDHAFRSREKCQISEEIGREIVRKCKGVPLVAKCLGGLMYKKSRQQWEDILSSNLWELEDVEAKVFAPFLLSYRDLPPVEKRCLSYCSVFPKDYETYKDALIQMWIAQGYLSRNNGKNLEQEGEDCFENLAMRSFFQDFVKDDDGNIVFCKMHDIMHDFVQFLAKKESRTTSKKPRHATALLSELENNLGSLWEYKGLRTLFVASPNIPRLVDSLSLERLFSNFTCLRTLNLSYGLFEQLPGGIEKLIHLRYLDLSGSSLKDMPDALCDLFNLQILRLKYCSRLEQLPKEIGKLVNLRHLCIRGCVSLKQLPKGIAKLSCLRTLDMFVVPDCSRLENNIEALELEDLHALKQLRGSLSISRCGNLRNGSKAERTQLKGKEFLKVELDFYRFCENGGADDEILNELEPHPKVETLTIIFYRGSSISPKWMNTLTYLKRLILEYCTECVFLHALGNLPALESLKIISLRRVKTVGVEFLGIENDENGAAPRSQQISFPKLKSLFFGYLSSWEKWESGIHSGGGEDNFLKVMPSLELLSIRYCNRLTSLPDFLQKTPLKCVHIEYCKILYERCQADGEDRPKISHAQAIQLVK